MEKLRILFIPFEFLTWVRGGAWPYSVHLGIEEGLQAHGIEYMTIPGTYEIPSNYSASWLSHAKRLCAGKQFDQVWFFLRHSQLDDTFLEWAAELAPVRVGFIMESLQPLPEELEESPHLTEIPPFMDNQISFMTHVLAYDERDSEDINAAGTTKAMWCPWAIPQRFLAFPPPPQREPGAAFFGAVYGRRAQFLSHPDLQHLLIQAPRTEAGTELPQLFDETMVYYHARLNDGQELDEKELAEYMNIVRRIRQNTFLQYIASVSRWQANVVLPAGFKGYSNRVVESAAAGVPIISWDVPDRPRNRQLFEPGQEILLFDPKDPSSLAEQIHHVLDRPDYASFLAQNLRRKVLMQHTSEVRVEQIVKWIAGGEEPVYR